MIDEFSRYTTLVFAIIFTLASLMAHSSIGAFTIDSVLLESEAIAGQNSDSFLEIDFGFYNAVSSFSVGLTEDYLASGVVQAEFTQNPFGPDLYLQLDALASATGNLSSSVTSTATIEFTTSTDHTLFILDPSFGVVLSRISDNAQFELITDTRLPAGSYRLFAELSASAGDGELIETARYASVTFRAVPEPATGALFLTFGGVVLGYRCFRRGDKTITIQFPLYSP